MTNKQLTDLIKIREESEGIPVLSLTGFEHYEIGDDRIRLHIKLKDTPIGEEYLSDETLVYDGPDMVTFEGAYKIQNDILKRLEKGFSEYYPANLNKEVQKCVLFLYWIDTIGRLNKIAREVKEVKEVYIST